MSPSRLLLALLSLLPVLQIAGCTKSETEALAKVSARMQTADPAAVRIELKNLIQSHPKSAEARRLLAMRLLGDGDAPAAIAELERALELGAPESTVLPMLAEALVQTGQFSRVTSAYTSTRLPQADAQARLMAAVAQAHMQLGNLPAAAGASDAALAADPRSAWALLGRARLQFARNELPAAMSSVEQALAADATMSDAWLLQGDLLLRQSGGRPAALAAFEKAVAASPDQVPPRLSLMAAQVAQGDLPAARAQLAELRKRAPKHINTAMADGQLAFASGDFARAREVFQGLLRVLPDNLGLLLIAGENELMLDSAQQAEAHFAKALALAPRNPTARRLLAKAQMRLGQIPRAIATLAPIADLPDASADVLAAAAQARALNGETRAAQALYDRLAKLKPTDPKLRTLVATAGFGRDDDNAVFAALRSIASEGPDSAADLALVNAHLARGQTEAALKALDGLDRKLPKDPVPTHMRGQVLAGLGRTADARASFQAALERRPGYFPALAALAALDMKDGKPEAARQRFADVIKAQPKNAAAMLALAEVLARQDAPAKDVRSQIDAAIKAAPGDAAARVALVNQWLAEGNREAALNAAQAANSALPDNTELLALLAQVQMRVGQPSQALASWGKIASLQPKSPDATLGMAEVHLATNQLDLAQRSINRTLELSPGLPAARAQAIMVALRQQQPAKAAEIARLVQSERPAEAVGYILEGEVLMRQGQWTPAAAVLRKALDKSVPGAARIKLYQALARSDKPQAADAFAEQWLKTQPQDVDLLFTMGDTAQARGDSTLAKKHYERVLALQPSHALALNNTAMLLLQQKAPGALALAERAVRARPNEPAILDTLALAQAADGRANDAVATQKRALAISPDAPDLRLGLARLLIQAGERAQAKAELDKLAKLETRFAQHDEVARLQKTLGPALPGR